MPLGEVGVRARQAVWKVTDRLVALLGRHAGDPRADRSYPPIPALGQADEVAAFVRRETPEQAAGILRDADRIIRGEVELLGSGWLALGFPPVWTREPLSGKEAPLRHWSRVRFLDPAEVGDSKIVWELNRHQHLLCLGQAYRLTGARRYADAAWSAVASWISENPVGRGINWCSSLEVALRAIAWCWLWCLADGPTTAPAPLRTALARVLAGHARHIEKYLSTYFSPNTHITGEALALCYVATSFPTFGRSPTWWRLGSEILTDAGQAQVHADGLHFERSTCYHLYTLDFFVHYALLHLARRESIPAVVKRVVAALADATRALRQPDGLLPHVGDDDGGRLLGCVSGPPRDPTVSLAAAAAVLGDGSLPPDQWPRGAAWLLGPPEAPHATVAARAETSGVRVFQESGFVAAKNSAGDYLLVSAGLQAAGQRCVGHVHDDAMSLLLWCDGQPVWIDPGTAVYTGDVGRRNWFRAAAAHAGAIVDGRPAVPETDAFRWATLARASLETVWHTDEAFGVELVRTIDLADGAVAHRRWVVGWWGHGWIVWDRFHGAGTRRVDLRFPLPPHTTFAVERKGMAVRLPTAFLAASADATPKAEGGLVDALASSAYGAVEPAKAWRIRLQGRLPFSCLVAVMRRPVGAGRWVVEDSRWAAAGETPGRCALELRMASGPMENRIAVSDRRAVGAEGTMVSWRAEGGGDGLMLVLDGELRPARVVAAPPLSPRRSERVDASGSREGRG